MGKSISAGLKAKVTLDTMDCLVTLSVLQFNSLVFQCGLFAACDGRVENRVERFLKDV